MTTNTLPVSDRAREAAAAWTKVRCKGLGMSDNQVGALAQTIERGYADDDNLVQAFARFEREITQSTADRVAELEAENARLRVRLSNSIGFAGGRSPIAHQPGGSVRSRTAYSVGETLKGSSDGK